MPDEPLWTVDDVAAFLKLSPKTIRDWQTARSLPFLKIGGTVRFMPETIRDWACHQTAGTALSPSTQEVGARSGADFTPRLRRRNSA